MKPSVSLLNHDIVVQRIDKAYGVSSDRPPKAPNSRSALAGEEPVIILFGICFYHFLGVLW